MLQRVMIATALLTEPRLILADEPTTALDVTTQAEVMAIIDELRKEFGVSLLFITHDLDLAAAVCDRTAVMYAGQLVRAAAAESLHDDPYHPYTAALAGARPEHGEHRGAAHGHPRPAGVGLRGSGRLCVCAPLPVRRGSLPRGPACDPRLRRGQGALRAGRGAARLDEGGDAWLMRCSRWRASARSSATSRRRRRVVSIEPGQSLAVVGESGSGKTTVARMIVGLERVTAGTIIGGRQRPLHRPRAVKDRRDRGREVQIVFQDPYSSLDPRQSGASPSTRC